MSETHKNDLSASSPDPSSSSGISFKNNILAERRKETFSTALLNKLSNNLDDETFVPDHSSLPYDPLTNYLSPCPKFRLYNPNRRLEAMVVRLEEVRSPHSQIYFTSEMGGNVGSEKYEEVDIEIGKGKSGFKWEFLRFLIVVVALVLFTVYICSMNNSLGIMSNGLKVEYQEFGNTSLKAVTLNVQHVKWVLDDMRAKGVFEFRKMGSCNQSNDGLLEEESSSDYEPNELESIDEAPSQQELEAEELEFELKYMYDQIGENISENEQEPELEVENEDEQWWINLKNVLVFIIPLFMIWVLYMVVEFYLMCKKASIASNVKLSTTSTKKNTLSRFGRMAKEN